MNAEIILIQVLVGVAIFFIGMTVGRNTVLGFLVRMIHSYQRTPPYTVVHDLDARFVEGYNKGLDQVLSRLRIHYNYPDFP